MKIEIKTYGNGSYSYYSESQKRHINIPSELAKAIIELQKQKASLEKEDRTVDINYDLLNPENDRP